MQLDRTPPYSSLLLLKTLCEKRNLAAAAEVLGLSASSASRHLSEMRELFDDKLFTRFPGGLVPTRPSTGNCGAVRADSGRYAALMRPARFNPAEMTREVCIAAPTMLLFHFPKIRRLPSSAGTQHHDFISAASRRSISSAFKRRTGFCGFASDGSSAGFAQHRDWTQ